MIECLHFADKGHLVFQDAELRQQFNFDSRTTATRTLRRVERLRNSLAHNNPLVPDHWDVVVQFSMTVERLLLLVDM